MNFTKEQTAKLTTVITEGVEVKAAITDMQEGLKDAVKAIAEEIGIKPAVLNKAIASAYKADFSEKSEDHDAVGEILDATGRKF